MNKVIVKNAKKKAVVSAVIGAVLLMGGGSVSGAVVEINVWEGDFPTHGGDITSTNNVFTFSQLSGEMKYGGTKTSDLTLISGITFKAFGSSSKSVGGFSGAFNRLTNKGTIVAKGGEGTSSFGFKQEAGTLDNANGGTITIEAGTGDSSVGYFLSGGEILNSGTLTAQASSTTIGFYQTGGTFRNFGTATFIGGSGSNTHGIQMAGVFENTTGVLNVIGGETSIGFYQKNTLTNSATMNATGGGSGDTPYGFYQTAAVNNNGNLTVTGGTGAKAAGYYLSAGTLTNNYGASLVIKASDKAPGFYQAEATEVVNRSSVTVTGGSAESILGYSMYDGTFTNTGAFTANGGNASMAVGFGQRAGTFTNSASMTLTGGTATSAYGYYFAGGSFTNTNQIHAVGGSAKGASGLYIASDFINQVALYATGSAFNAEGVLQVAGSLTNSSALIIQGGNATEQGSGSYGYVLNGGTVTNKSGGLIRSIGSNNKDDYGFYINGGTVVNENGATIYCDTDDAAVGAAFYQKSGTFKNSGTIRLVANKGAATGFDQEGGEFSNLSDGAMTVNGGTSGAVYGYVLGSGATFSNSGTLTSVGGSGSQSHGFYQVGGTFTNEEGGVLDLTAGTSASTAGFYQQGGEFVNNGTIKAAGNEIDKSYGFYQSGSVTNNGIIETTGGNADDSGKESVGYYIGKDQLLNNNENGVIYLSSGDDFALSNNGAINNYGTICVKKAGSGHLLNNSGKISNSGLIDIDMSDGGSSGGAGVSLSGTLVNSGRLILTAMQLPALQSGTNANITNNKNGYIKASGGNGGSWGTGLLYQSTLGGLFTNEGIIDAYGGQTNSTVGIALYGALSNSGTINAYGGVGENAQGIRSLFNRAVITNLAAGVLNIFGGETSTASGFENGSQVINQGTINLKATYALNALGYNGGTFEQSSSDARISGNLLAFADYTEGSGGSAASPVNFIGADNTAVVDSSLFVTKSGEGGIKSMANFLTSKISGGTINITDTDWSEEAQQTIKEAIYGTGVTSDVNITFAGTGDKGFGASYKKTVDLAHARSFVAAGYEGAVLYEDTMNAVSGGLTVGNSSSAMGSLGFKSVASDVVTITDGKALTLLGDGTQLAGTAGKVTVNNGELKLGFIHDVTKDTTQGGELSTVSLADAGKLSVADVNGTYRISDKLSLADKATLTNAGKLSVASVAFAGNNATVTNTGTTVVKTASGSGKGNTLKNAGIYSQTDLSAFGDVQNKGTLKTGTLTVGAADKLVNGGTILAEKITVDGLLQNRNGTFALGTAAVAKYLEKHLDLAQQLKDLGETLPTSVETLLSAQSDAEAATLTTLELADGERPVESDDETSETTESTDFASLFAEIQAAKAPQGRLATREGRLAFAGFSTYADNRVQLERQLQSGLSGLWADFIASQSEMDRYKANRSGIAVGLQGTNDAGMTFGVAARYSDGKLKGDALTSENWTSAGGSTYAAWDNDDAFVSGFIGYDNLKTKGADKLTNDVVSAGVKSGLKLDVGPVHVTPFVGGEVVHQKVKGLNAATTYRFPMGVGLSGQYETYGAWQVYPSLEVAFVPLAGDKVIDVSDKVDSRFAGNYAVESRLGIAVEKKNLMLGINYHGSAGDAGLRSHSLQANVKYRF